MMKKQSEQPGALKFWKCFNSFFLNANKLPLSKAYALAKNICEKNGIVSIPSERQVRYWYKHYTNKDTIQAIRNPQKKDIVEKILERL